MTTDERIEQAAAEQESEGNDKVREAVAMVLTPDVRPDYSLAGIMGVGA